MEEGTTAVQGSVGALDSRPMTVGEWMVTFLVLAIPIVNVVMTLVWALSSSGNLNRRNFCRAAIIWWAMIVGIVIVVMGLGVALSGLTLV